MIIYLYRWRIKPGLETQFVENWSLITKYYVENAGSLGSRLHRGDDGIWYAYAQWSFPGQREQAFAKFPDESVRESLSEAVEEFLGETVLDIQVDHLISHP